MNVRRTPALLQDRPHRRYNPIAGEWVLVSPHRVLRPWQGKTETATADPLPAYDRLCYLCPGNSRANGASNPEYTGVYVFENDFGALLPEPGGTPGNDHPLLRHEPVQGVCRVLCFSPQHNMTLALMSVADIRRVVDMWADQVEELGQRYRWIQIFENRGEIMGCSNAHPHGQLWAGSAMANEPFREDSNQRAYRRDFGSVLLLDYLEVESDQGARVIVANQHWAAVVPFWAKWPFETLLLPRRAVQRIPDLEDSERLALADLLKQLLTRYDNLFRTSFPYTMGWHGAPHESGDSSHWQLHAHFYPPLLRSANVQKFMVGYEMLAEPQRDITPESAAERLRTMPDVHYTINRGDRCS